MFIRQHYSHITTALAIASILVCLSGCGKAAKPTTNTSLPPFSADSAYLYVAQQVSMGARVPGSEAHHECAVYLQSTLRRFGAEVEVQQGQMRNYAGNMQQVVNIIARYGNPGKRRILLCAHYDTRPWADQEEEYTDRMKPILGANDGASGVGVLLEIARQLGLKQEGGEAVPPVDIVFFDCEDMGTPDFYTGQQREDTWCLGSQLWAQQLKQTNHGQTSSPVRYSYGILLDMVGAPDALFPREYYSEAFAGNRVEEVWRAAKSLGYGAMFQDVQSYPITDDHYYVNTLAGIPCIDIIHYNPRNNTGFAHWWHTHNDDMTNISPHTLEAVGKTLMQCILYN